MNRRKFFKASTILLTFPAAGKLNDLLLRRTETGDFSLNVITKEPDIVLPELQNFINSLELEKGLIKYSEQKLSGKYKSDLTFIQNSRLIDYKKKNNLLSEKLCELNKKLELSSELEDPVMIKIYNHNFNKAGELYAYQDNELKQKIVLSSDERHYNFKGNNGKLTIEVKDNKARVIESTCTHKTCTKMSAASYSGDNLICIPNRIYITAV